MEAYTWIIILACWILLLLLGLAGGDPLAAGRPGHEAPAVAAGKWLYRAWLTRAARQPTPSRRGAAAHPTESGLHAIA